MNSGARGSKQDGYNKKSQKDLQNFDNSLDFPYLCIYLSLGDLHVFVCS